MTQRRSAINRAIERALLVVVAVTCMVSSSPQAFAVSNTKESESFRAQNDVLYSDDSCSSASSTLAGNANTPRNTGPADPSCGEQGYGDGQKSQKNKDQAWAFLKSKGLSDIAAAGIMGNMAQETGDTFKPDAVNWINCVGIVQWCDRGDAMKKYAADHGKDWTCLSAQLDFMWYEMTETAESQVMGPLNAATSPGEAAMTFARIYERPGENEYAGRDTRADTAYQEYTGQNPAPVTPSNTLNGNSPASQQCTTANNAASTTPGAPGQPAQAISGDCPALVDRLRQLKDQGKIHMSAGQFADVEKCGGSSCGAGVQANTVRVLIALAEQSGTTPTIGSLNSDHYCDGAQHGHGVGIDVSYFQNDPEGEKAYKFLYDNADTLNVDKLIWGSVNQQGWTPMPGYQCMFHGKPIDCYTTYSDDHGGGGDHSDHIHISVKPDSGGFDGSQ